MLGSIERWEQQTRLVQRSRFSDVHRVVAERYLRTRGGREILHRYRSQSAPLTVPKLGAAATALGVAAETLEQGR